MKKIKYLLWCFVVWFWLLINQSFADNYYFEWVTLPLTNSNLLSSSYLYTFISNWDFQAPYFWYTLYYDWLTHENITQQSCNWSTCSNVPIHQFNNSIYWLELLNDVIYHNSRNWWNVNNSSQYNNKISIYMGQWDQFWKNFIFAWSPLYDNTWSYSAHYSLWNWFLSSPSYLTINSSLSNFYRIFFDQNINLSSPLDWYSIVTWSWSNITWSTARMYFTQNTPRFQTKYNDQPKYFIDYWSQWKKGLHFWGYWMGYSYAIDFSQDNSTLLWWNWSFGSVWSICWQSAMQLWLTDFDTLTSNNCLNLWLLVLKWDSYVSRQNNWSVLVLWKNPNNTKQILYEQYDCAQDDIIRIMDSQFCVPMWHWYITYNWSWDILPFDNLQDTYTIWNWNSFLDTIFSKGIYWFVSMSSNQYCINSSSNSFCFWLRATPNLQSLKEMYLQNSWDIAWIGWTVGGSWLTDIVINQPSSYFTYSWLLELAGGSALYSWFDVDWTWIYNWNFINSWLWYTFINWVPALSEYHFWFCPFISIFWQIEPTISFDWFSFDLLAPFRCILTSFQYWFLNLNSPDVEYDKWLLINNESFCAFIWVVLCWWSLLICFKFLNRFF